MVSLVVLSTGDTAEGKTDGDDIIVTVSISHLRRMFAKNEESRVGTSLAVQWLRLHCPVHEAQVQFLSREHVLWPKIIIVITIKQKQYCNKFKKDFKNGPHKKNNLKRKKRKQGKMEWKVWLRLGF